MLSFDTIPKDRLMELIRKKISDRRLLALIESFLDQSILEELTEWTPESGILFSKSRTRLGGNRAEVLNSLRKPKRRSRSASWRSDSPQS